MMRLKKSLFSLLFLTTVSIWIGFFSPPRATGADLPPESAVKPVQVVPLGDYSEGVVVDHQGNLYVSHDKIVTKVTPGGKATTWAVTGSPDGHKILADGTHLICDASRHALLHLDADGHLLEPSATDSDGQPLRHPNDLALDPSSGGVYFTDPANSDEKNPDGTIHYLDSQGLCHTVASGLAFPTGIAVRPTGKELLVAESMRHRILAFPVLEPGKLGEKRVFVDLPGKGPGPVEDQPDGLALDSDGNLYVAHAGMRQVEVISPEAKLVRRYPAGNLKTSSLAFAGPHMDRLYMTGGEPGALFRIDLPGVKGLTILPQPNTK